MKIFEIFTKLLTLWVIIAGILAFYYPSIFVKLKNYTDFAFGFTMLGIGALLNFGDFKNILKKPQIVLLGTLAQFSIMPLSAYIITKLLKLSDELAVGFIMVGSVPGAMASNVISYLAKADVVYSVSLTTTSTLLSPIVTPTLVYFLAKAIIKVDFWAMFFSIIKMVIIPLFIGLLLRHFFKNFILKIEKIFPAISTIFIAFICGLVVALNKNFILKISGIVFLGVFLVNLLGLFGGYQAGILYGLNKKQRRTLSIEVGMQNAGLGAVLSLKHFTSLTALPNALFATWCVITASILAAFWSYKTNKDL